MGPGPREGAGACSFAARAGGGGCWERPRRIRRGAMIPAARRRRLSGKRLGRRSAASGDSAPAGGLVQRGCAPHCRRRKVRSAPFPPAAKTAPAPLRLLSPPRGARRGPLSVLPQKRTRRARCKRKSAFGRNFARSCKVAVRGSAYRCLLRFGLAFGHAMLFCDSCCCRPVADGADLVGVVVAWSCFSFRYRSRSREESGSA